MMLKTLLAAASCLTALTTAYAKPTAPAVSAGQAESVNAVMDELWKWRLSQKPLLAVRNDVPVQALPADTLETAQAKAIYAAALLVRLDAIERRPLTDLEKVQVATMRFELTMLVKAVDFYWQTLTVTPYKTNFLTNEYSPVFQRFRFAGADDADRYLRLAADYATAFSEAGKRLTEQQRRDVLLPAPALPGAITLYRRLALSLPELLRVGDDRLTALLTEERQVFRNRLEAILRDRLSPALNAVADRLASDAYRAKAPALLGVRQFPQGADYYRYLILSNTTLDRSPEEIHTLGMKRMASLHEKMATVRRSLNFNGDAKAFRAHLESSSQFRAATPQKLEEYYRACVDRIRPELAGLFAQVPNAPYDVKRARPEAEAGMTFGYYDMPQKRGETGYYYYNGSDLDAKPTFTNCAMIFHELVPGHHFHVASQQENESLHPLLRTNYSFTAYNEGWAEYAASLAIEAGAFRDDPYSLYGRYLMEAHVIARLVVDTGLNALGWSSEQAARYLRENTLLSDKEIESEVLRYGTDIPGQALAYGIGYLTIWDLRHEAEREMGDRFDIRAFHQAILGDGGMPLPVLHMRVRQLIDAAK